MGWVGCSVQKKVLRPLSVQDLSYFVDPWALGEGPFFYLFGDVHSGRTPSSIYSPPLICVTPISVDIAYVLRKIAWKIKKKITHLCLLIFKCAVNS